MMTGAAARRTILHNAIFKRMKRLPLSTHNFIKPLYQAVSAHLPNGYRARTAYLHCIKDGTNIDLACVSGSLLIYTFVVASIRLPVPAR